MEIGGSGLVEKASVAGGKDAGRYDTTRVCTP